VISGRENTRRLFDRKRPERVGVTEVFWDDTLTKWVTQGYPTEIAKRMVEEKVLENGREVMKQIEREADGPADPDRHFNLDLHGAGGDARRVFDIMPLRGVKELVTETDEWTITRNGAGASFKFWKNKSGTPEHVDFRMTSREVWERDYRPHLLKLDRERVNIPATKEVLERRRAEGRFTGCGNLFVWEGMRSMLGDICLYESLLLDPDWIHDYCRVYTDFHKTYYKILLEEAGVPDGVWLCEDLGYNKGLFCSPKVLSELIFPYYKEIVEFFHSYGLITLLHSCGSQREALPLIVEAGFDALNPIEVAAGNDIFEYAEKYGDKFVFIGGFDKRIIESHDKALIRREVRKFIRGMKERGARFIMGSDHSISTNTDYQDYLCYLEAYREEMMY
jgi:uroporphyrinogen decarboxylase